MTLLGDVATIAHEAAGICAALMERKVHERSEGLKKQAVGLLVRAAFLKLSMLLIAAGTGFLLWGGYRLLAACTSPAAASLIIGGGIFVLGLLLCWIVKKTIT